MAIDKSLISGNTDMLILKLLEKQDMYGLSLIHISNGPFVSSSMRIPVFGRNVFLSGNSFP